MCNSIPPDVIRRLYFRSDSGAIKVARRQKLAEWNKGGAAQLLALIGNPPPDIKEANSPDLISPGGYKFRAGSAIAFARELERGIIARLYFRSLCVHSDVAGGRVVWSPLISVLRGWLCWSFRLIYRCPVTRIEGARMEIGKGSII